MTDGFERALPRIVELAAWCETHRAWGKVTVSDLSALLNWPRAELCHTLDHVLGITPDDWAEPTTYSVAALLEAATRHEVAARY